ncbi:SUMF1/EgtB/PvdO family nonheme iron enzyme, partial [Pseudotamlana agarivorans]|uniref:SUMF1/EgtB/PvdO family nonheme iron enzyme n=1 Tax=Pseudotamlana agarivorans TaxID=481183 RepID=UPI000A85C43C
GNQSLGYVYSGSNDPDDVAVKSRNSTAPVGTKLPNELGIYDMSGNVSEICEDYYASNYYANSPSINPINTVYTSFGRVTRGRSFHLDAAPYFRNKTRFRLSGEQYMDYSGFRLVKSADYTVSGVVADSEGNPLANVSVLGFPTSVLTDVNGNYSTTITGGWSGGISTYLNGYTNKTGLLKLNYLSENSINNDFILEQEKTIFNYTILVTNGINPLNGISVNFNGIDYITKANGEIQANNLAIGTYNYVINEFGFYEVAGQAVLTKDNLIKTIVLQEKTLSNDDLELDEVSNKFIVYPNPSNINEDFFIKYGGRGMVSIYNLVGQLIYENKINNSLKVSLKSKGLFLIHIKSESGVLSKKLVIR